MVQYRRSGVESFRFTSVSSAARKSVLGRLRAAPDQAFGWASTRAAFRSFPHLLRRESIMGMRMRGPRRGALAAAAAAAALACMGSAANAASTYADTYTTDTSGNYTLTDNAGLNSTWTVGGGTLNYARTAGGSWASS